MREIDMNLLDKVATMVDGAKNLTLWLGSGGLCVSQEEAQGRADICNKAGPNGGPCPLNKEGSEITKEVADATHAFLRFKNELELKVQGERSLKHCEACGCVLRLMIWEPLDRVQKQMDAAELKLTPSYCWKIKKV